MVEQSGFAIYSLGIVAKDMPLNSNITEVFATEKMSQLRGSINDKQSIDTTLKDMSGNNITANVDTTMTLSCKWLPIGNSCVITPPSVCKGEAVIIYTNSGTDEYFFTTLGTDLDLRKLDSYTLFVSAKPGVDTADWRKKGYAFTMDAKNKYVAITTSKFNGEAAAYQIDLDTGKGIFTISDDRDNYIQLQTTRGKLIIKVAEGVEVTAKDTVFKTNTFSVGNGAGELMDILQSLCNILATETHVDSMGGNTKVSNGTNAAIMHIQNKIKSFIKG